MSYFSSEPGSPVLPVSGKQDQFLSVAHATAVPKNKKMSALFVFVFLSEIQDGRHCRQNFLESHIRNIRNMQHFHHT
jgi:hypothetical protein